MALEQTLRARVENLVREGASLSRGHPETDSVFDNDHLAKCRGWLASAKHAVEAACGPHSNAYIRELDTLMGEFPKWQSHIAVGAISQVLIRLLQDIDDGLIVSIANRARAEVFDDFLDHGQEYLKVKRVAEAGVIVGVVFEDSIRRICRNNDIEESGEKLDNLITRLAKVDLLASIQAKRARVAAGVRTSATHAQWDKFDEGDVRSALEFTRSLIEAHLEQAQ